MSGWIRRSEGFVTASELIAPPCTQEGVGVGTSETGQVPSLSAPTPGPSLRAGRGGSNRPLHQQLLGLGDRLGGVEALRADVGAVHDRVAAIETERVLQ